MAETAAVEVCEEVMDGRGLFSRYLRRIELYGQANEDRFVAEIIGVKLAIVRGRLRALRGVATKKRLLRKAPTSQLWDAADAFEREYQRRRGKVSLFKLPTKAYYGYSGYEQPYGSDKFLNPRYRTFDVHHIWPETLEGPTTGWNVMPLPKHLHLFELHKIIAALVRDTQPGQMIRLL